MTDLNPNNLTIFNATGSDQKAYPFPEGNKKQGGIFTDRILGGLASGGNINKSFKNARSEVPNLAYQLYPGKKPEQNPVSYGSKVPNGLLDPNRSDNRGVALIVQGKERGDGDTGIQVDVDKAKAKYQKLGLDVSVVKTFEELKTFEASLKEKGDKQTGDIFIQHISGHASSLRRETKGLDGVGSRTRPAVINNRSSEGVFEMTPSAGEEGPAVKEGTAFVHEDNLTSPLFTASSNFDHAVGIIDTCAAGCFDNKNSTESMSKVIQVDPDDIVDNAR